MNRARAKMTGFTLIELLLVVAIIVALLAILLPAMGRAIEAAVRVQCGSKLHQIGIGMSSYAFDNLGAWPNRGNDVNTEPHRMVGSFDIQTAFIEPYLTDRDAMMFCPSSLLDARNPVNYPPANRWITYQYHVFNSSTRWVVPMPGLLTVNQPDRSYALWSCLTIDATVTRGYFGHDRPIVDAPPDGMNSAFTDGSSRWTAWDDCENYILDASVQFYVWPKKPAR